MPMRKSLLQPVVGSSVYIAQNVKTLPEEEYHVFGTADTVCYHPLCDDFGPMNMSSIFKFIQILDDRIEKHPACKIVYLAEHGKRPLTNAVFLLGAYMILKLNLSSKAVSDRFSWLDASAVVPYRDATFAEADFDLTLLDCWQGLERGKKMGWVAFQSDKSGIWGKIDKEEYDLLDDPLNADLHVVVPGKFVAFKGPRDLGDDEYQDTKQGYRYFSPTHYAKIFKYMQVSDVVRLNEDEYDGEDFCRHGIKHHDLEFEDCSAPPEAIVESFLRIVDATPGLVAVHCKAGLGRTGTLIALYMMRTYNFTAREAMGWLRIMRPGSVIGEQQQYLCDVEKCLCGTATVAKTLGTTAIRTGGTQKAVLASQVANGMERRGAARAVLSGSGSGAAAGATQSGRRKWLPAIKAALMRAASGSALRVR